MINSTDRKKKAIAEYFSDSDKVTYWKSVYDAPSNSRVRSFRDSVTARRKEYVLRAIDAYAKNRLLRILDIGCGSGGILGSILDRGHFAVGLDISFEMVLEAKRIIDKEVREDAASFQGDLESLPFFAKSFDIVVCVGVLQFQKTDKIALSEISRVVMKDGMVIITAPNILRINNLLDPYYALNRGPMYIFYRFMERFRKDRIPTKHDFGANKDFSNRRYFFGRLPREAKFHNLDFDRAFAVGFGPMTFWLKEWLPLPLSLKLSDFFEKLANKRRLNAMKYFADRWVYTFRKVG